MMNNEMGWRARIGVLVPSPNWVVEAWFNRVAPEGVSFHAARMHLGKVSTDAVDEMMKHSLRAIKEVASAKVDAVAYCCTASTLIKGPEFDKEIIKQLSQEAGVPVITATSAILRAFEVLKVKAVAIANPYPREFDEIEVRFFEGCGLKVMAIKGMGISDPVELARPSPEEIYRFAKEIWDPRADALFISCLNFRAQAAIEALERDIKKPVITSTQATLWNVLRTANVHEPISGYGRLLAEF